jgi:hypothetical protein
MELMSKDTSTNRIIVMGKFFRGSAKAFYIKTGFVKPRLMETLIWNLAEDL